MIRWLLGPLVKMQRHQIVFLEGRIAWLEQQMKEQRRELREEMLHERQRCEYALDACRLAHQSLTPITAPLMPDRQETPGPSVREIVGAADWQNMGSFVSEPR